ncbi:unnamed protein product [Urochloa decumbens]|uniref:DUF4220 domain-containing protein n=1 Tax=Urochloa decumbens TaxID=240449 RepID=A0ABC9AJK1_9POAL
MGFTGAVQWWEEWQLRVLVLASLFIQFFLFFTASLRKYSIPAWFRFVIWLAYLGSDAVAIYALAVLFNRQKQQEWVSTHRSSYSLQVLWAPILLIHLGGQDGITAYNIEDNELWTRHVLTAISQVTVAVYVFSKSWSGDDFILQAAILLFIFGTGKCLLKPWDLKRVSINSLVDSFGSRRSGGISSFDQYIGVVTQHFQGMHSLLRAIVQQVQAGNNRSVNSEALHPDGGESFRLIIWKPYRLLVDLTPSYSARFEYLKYIVCYPGKAHLLVRCGLSETFDRLYTKKWLELPGSPAEPTFPELGRRGLTWLFLSFDGIIFLVRLTMASNLGYCLALFQKGNKQAYNQTDVKITFALLYPPAILDLVIPWILAAIRAAKFLNWLPPWPDHVAQYNLIGYLARNRKHWILRKLPRFVKDFIDQLWSMKPYNSSGDITELVANHVTAGWWQIHGIDSYHRFNDSRGQWTLGREGLLGFLGWSVRRPFDESLLLWHLATDLICFEFHHNMATPPATTRQQRQAAACRSRAMSNYMAYLLFINPEMLIPGARRSLFRDAYEELEGIIIPPDDGQPLPGAQEELVIASIIRRLRQTEGSSSGSGSGVADDAWKVTKVLIGLHEQEDDVDKVWRVVQGVWVEMLCFSAGRCRGYLHAKSMGSGGQYLSYVWLLLCYMGMETLAEKMQRTDLQHQETHEAGTGTAAVPRSAVPARSPGGGGGGQRPSPPAPVPIQTSTSPASAAGAGDNNDVVLTID